MKTITNNEMKFILTILKNPKLDYNANNISKKIGITSMGALKIAKKLEKESILISRELGKAKFYKLNLNNDYVKKYVVFLLKRESEQVSYYTRKWVNEVKKINNADIIILFGSILRKKEVKDVDVLLITNEKRFSKLKKEVEEINFVNTKELHPIYQTEKDFKTNIEKKDKIVLDAIRGIVVFGEDKFMELIK